MIRTDPTKGIEQVRSEIYDAIDEALDTFQWSRDRGNNFGEISLNRDAGRLHLVVYVADSDDPDDEETKPLDISQEVDLWDTPEVQIRAIVHWFICHEADEQLWFNNDRPFYPHNEDGSLIT